MNAFEDSKGHNPFHYKPGDFILNDPVHPKANMYTIRPCTKSWNNRGFQQSIRRTGFPVESNITNPQLAFKRIMYSSYSPYRTNENGKHTG